MKTPSISPGVVCISESATRGYSTKLKIFVWKLTKDMRKIWRNQYGQVRSIICTYYPTCNSILHITFTRFTSQQAAEHCSCWLKNFTHCIESPIFLCKHDISIKILREKNFTCYILLIDTPLLYQQLYYNHIIVWRWRQSFSNLFTRREVHTTLFTYIHFILR